MWAGKKCNRFYVCEIGTAVGGTDSNTTGASFVFLESSAKTDRGYGYAWWVNAYASNTTCFLGGEDVGFCIGVGNAWPASPASYSSGKKTRLWYKTGTPSKGSETNTYISKTADPQLPKAFASKGLSDVFNSVISIWQPSFTLFEFLDSGDITLNFGIQRNGYIYEGGARGGSSGEPGFVGGLSGSGVRVYLKQAGTKTIKLDLSTNAGLPEGSWNAFTCTVQAGDTITLDCAPASGSSTSLTYAVFYFSNQIPGWEVE